MSQDEHVKRTDTYAREHLANERTHLAYVRTALALVSFGITINRISLYFLETEASSTKVARSLLRDIVGAGSGMVLLGMALMVWSAVRYLRVSRALDRGEYQPDRAAVLIVTAVLFLGGTASVVWLFSS